MDMNEKGIGNNIRGARDSFSGRLLTGGQFEDAIAITNVIQREISRSGTFKDKLGDYVYAFARSERFDAVKADTIVRDLFKERLGMTMNQLREKLVEREKSITDADRARAYRQIGGIQQMMQDGNKVSFGRAYAFQAEDLAGTLRITEITAKALMKEAFQAAGKGEISEWGKDLDERIYRPQIEADTRAREAQSRTHSQGRGRSGPSGP